MTVFLVLLGWTVGVAVLGYVGHQLWLRHASRELLFRSDDDQSTSSGDRADGFLRRWLALAGFRSRQAPATYVTLQTLALAVGVGGAWLVQLSGLVAAMTRYIGVIPGGVGDVFLPFALLAPWIVGVILSAIPLLVVRHARRERVARVEEDLPLTLELLATLSEAGLGFDEALTRILEAQPARRPLAEELRAFQLEVMAGQPRIACLRRMARRLDVSSVTIFVSALVQAEQAGAGVARTLRRQADDLRDRRRERALAFAAALPVKLLFPLMICFLPGIFVVTLGPTFYQFFQLAETIIRNRGLK